VDHAGLVETLKEILLSDGRRSAVVASTADLVRRRVGSTKGMTGMAARGGLGLVKKISPSFVEDAVASLLPDFVNALEPFFCDLMEEEDGAQKFGSYLGARDGAVADALLDVTDEKIGHARPAVQSAYRRMRGAARQHVRDAVPDLGDMLAKHLT
jgi:hypothetical protein